MIGEVVELEDLADALVTLDLHGEGERGERRECAVECGGGQLGVKRMSGVVRVRRPSRDKAVRQSSANSEPWVVSERGSGMIASLRLLSLSL